VIYNATMIADATIVFDGHVIADATMVLASTTTISEIADADPQRDIGPVPDCLQMRTDSSRLTFIARGDDSRTPYLSRRYQSQIDRGNEPCTQSIQTRAAISCWRNFRLKTSSFLIPHS